MEKYNPVISEAKWQEYWRSQAIYAWELDIGRENNFVIDTPPPTISGNLHIGHIFSYTHTDFIARFQRMKGKNVFYPMGFDNNGLPTERLVEKKRGIKAYSKTREEFKKECFEVIEQAEKDFTDLFERMGLSIDWSLKYTTITKEVQKLSQMSFIDLLQKGYIYRDYQPIFWDPVDQTALAQADLEDKTLPSFMNKIKFYTEAGEEIIIATTRPELIFACSAIFYNPEDARYKHLRNQQAFIPLCGYKVPIIADELVSIEKGTGLVMCCTFGDTTDIKWWRKHNLTLRPIVTKTGHIDLSKSDNLKLKQEYYTEIDNTKVQVAREKIIKILEQENLIISREPITHAVKCAERSGAPIEIVCTSQWFVKVIDFKDDLLSLTERINWHPETMKKRLINWIEGVNWDWCISRQRFFGVPFPVWYSKRAGEEGKILVADISRLPIDPLESLPRGYSKDEVEPDKDVMDTWATSSITPQINSQAITENFYIDSERHNKLFPSDLRPQAHEIIRTWAFYTILKSFLHQHTVPWHNIMISGWCLAEDKSKMSKSKGNIIDPRGVLKEHSADVIRYWASTARLGADTTFSEDVIKNGKKLVNKLWNASKFANLHFQNIPAFQQIKSLQQLEKQVSRKMDLWILNKLNLVIKNATDNLQNFDYCTARENIESFFWQDFCDNYLEIIKTRIYNSNGQDSEGQISSVVALSIIMENILLLFAPFIPYVTEEIYQNIFSYKDRTSIHIQGAWPQIITSMNDSKILAEGDYIIKIIDIVRKTKSMRNLSVKSPVKAIEIKSQIQVSDDLIQDLKDITHAERIDFVNNFTDKGEIFKIEDSEVNIMI